MHCARLAQTRWRCSALHNWGTPPNEAPRHQEVPEQPMHMKQLALNALQTLLMLPKATTELTDPTENTPLTASSANRPLTASSDHAAFMA